MASVAVLLATANAALAADEIQIYNTQIVAVGQWTTNEAAYVSIQEPVIVK